MAKKQQTKQNQKADCQGSCEQEELAEETMAGQPEVAEGKKRGKAAQKDAAGNAQGQAEDIAAELEKARALAEDYKNKWYSVAAEYDNYRKRTASQSAQAYDQGKAEAILKLLPVSDNFGYARDAAQDEATRDGIDKIIKNFANILISLGVEEVEISPGDDFDESVAEAVMNVPCGEGERPNVVKAVFRKGYRQNGKIIRFAQVSVTG